jgi:Zinc dependent phospholipase C
MDSLRCSLRCIRPRILLLCLLMLPLQLGGYSVLSHEALIDTVWGTGIVPLLLKAYPGATEAELLEAHSYAYGGCIIQDMGYYPFGNHFFTDLTHYVRTGDFIKELLDRSQNLNEYAFALGALAHYSSDTVGHSVAINRAVPDMYPKLRRKYGPVVTYEEDPKAHLMVEFSFDVVHIAGAGYLPETYHNFVGFRVAKELLERSFVATYGIEFKALFFNEDLAIGTYRRGASEVVPRLTQIAWKKKKSEILKVDPAMTRKRFVYKLSRSNYEKEWGRTYRRSTVFSRALGREGEKISFFAHILVFFFELLPKIGPLQTLKFEAPTPYSQSIFVDSFRATLDDYQARLGELKHNHLVLENKNLDTGKLARRGEYRLAGRTYSKLLDRLASDHFRNAPPELRSEILLFYSGQPAPDAEDHLEAWKKMLRELDELRALK